MKRKIIGTIIIGLICGLAACAFADDRVAQLEQRNQQILQLINQSEGQLALLKAAFFDNLREIDALKKNQPKEEPRKENKK